VLGCCKQLQHHQNSFYPWNDGFILPPQLKPEKTDSSGSTEANLNQLDVTELNSAKLSNF